MKIDLLNDLTNDLLIETLPDILYVSLTLSALKCHNISVFFPQNQTQAKHK